MNPEKDKIIKLNIKQQVYSGIDFTSSQALPIVLSRISHLVECQNDAGSPHSCRVYFDDIPVGLELLHGIVDILKILVDNDIPGWDSTLRVSNAIQTINNVPIPLGVIFALPGEFYDALYKRAKNDIPTLIQWEAHDE